MKRLALALALLTPSWLAGPAFAESYPEARRVLSLGGSITEIIYALGDEARLVRRDAPSSRPPAANALPRGAHLRRAAPRGGLNVAPDMILAEEGAGPPEAVAVLQSTGLPYVAVPERYDIAGVLDKVDRVSEALGVPEKGRDLREKLAADLAAVQARSQAVGTP